MLAQRAQRLGASVSPTAAVGGALALAGLAAVIAVAVHQRWVGAPVARLSDARPVWLWIAGIAFAVAPLCSACAWRSGLRACGASIGRVDAAARYGVGSLLNTVLPGHAGQAARIALLSRTIPAEGRLWIAGGVAAAIGAVRAAVLCLLVLAASLSGALPFWPVLVFASFAAAAVVVAACARRRRSGRLADLLKPFDALARSPRRAAPLFGWIAIATSVRLLGVAAVTAALGVHAPVTSALLIVLILALAGSIQLLPGNLGLTSGAVAVALHGTGVGLPSALASGVALQAVETAAALVVGGTGAAFLAFPSPAGRRWTLAVAAGGACLLALAFGATVVEPLV